MKNLTPMQAAYWTGRQATGFLGNVSAHLYVEFDCGCIAVDRLEDALRATCKAHPMLRMRITKDGQQAIGEVEKSPLLEVEDLTALSPESQQMRLAEKRRLWTGRSLDLSRGETAAFGISLLSDTSCRLHVDTDMAAIDPPSFCLIVESLAEFYEAPHADGHRPSATFFDWLDAKAADPEFAKRQVEDKAWWKTRLDEVPPAPSLPKRAAGQSARSGRRAAQLSSNERKSLERSARDLRITSSALMLGLFAAVIGKATGDQRFRLNVPMFWREPYVADVGRIVGDFSNVLILGVDLDPEASLASLSQCLAGRLRDLLAHSAYPGVSVTRDLSRLHRSLQTAPIVFTAGLDLPEGDLFSERVARVFGPMIWAISEGPQVALDAQVAALDGGILINWDIRYDALLDAWIDAAFDSFVSLVKAVAADPRTLKLPAASLQAETATEVSGSGQTERMICELLGRLAPGVRQTGKGQQTIGQLGLSPEDMRELTAFLQRYIPSASIHPADIPPECSVAALAGLISKRSEGASEKVAQAFLAAITPSAQMTAEAEPAE